MQKNLANLIIPCTVVVVKRSLVSFPLNFLPKATTNKKVANVVQGNTKIPY